MIDESVIEVFKASLARLANSNDKATGFQITMLGEKSKGKLSVFLVQDDAVAQTILDYFDHLARDTGGRKLHYIQVRPGALPDEN